MRNEVLEAVYYRKGTKDAENLLRVEQESKRAEKLQEFFNVYGNRPRVKFITEPMENTRHLANSVIQGQSSFKSECLYEIIKSLKELDKEHLEYSGKIVEGIKIMKSNQPNLCKLINKAVDEEFNINLPNMGNPYKIIWDDEEDCHVIVDSDESFIEADELFKIMGDPSLIKKCYSPRQNEVIKSLITLGFTKVMKNSTGNLLAISILEDTLLYSSLPNNLKSEFEFLECNRTFNLIKLEVEEYIHE